MISRVPTNSLVVHCLADDFEHFHRVNKKLMEKRGESPWFKRVPFQLYLIDEKVRVNGCLYEYTCVCVCVCVCGKSYYHTFFLRVKNTLTL